MCQGKKDMEGKFLSVQSQYPIPFGFCCLHILVMVYTLILPSIQQEIFMLADLYFHLLVLGAQHNFRISTQAVGNC